MAALEYFLVSESCSVDQRTNRVSLFNIIDEIHPTELPGVIPQLVAASTWIADEGDSEQDFQARLEIALEDQVLENYRHNFRIPGRRARTFQLITGLRLEQAGRLRMNLFLNDDHKASHTIDVAEPDRG